METKITIFIAVFVQVVSSQRLISPINYPPGLAELISQCSQTVLNLSPAESDTICKNFANSIQNVMLEKFAQNCLRKPVFNQIAPPLINEVATNVCKCPACSVVNLTPNSYSKTYITPTAVSNIIRNANGFVNTAQVPVNALCNNVPINALVNNGPANVPVNFVTGSNNITPANNVQIMDLLLLLKGLNECPCRSPVRV